MVKSVAVLLPRRKAVLVGPSEPPELESLQKKVVQEKASSQDLALLRAGEVVATFLMEAA